MQLLSGNLDRDVHRDDGGPHGCVQVTGTFRSPLPVPAVTKFAAGYAHQDHARHFARFEQRTSRTIPIFELLPQA